MRGERPPRHLAFQAAQEADGHLLQLTDALLLCLDLIPHGQDELQASPVAAHLVQFTDEQDGQLEELLPGLAVPQGVHPVDQIVGDDE